MRPTALFPSTTVENELEISSRNLASAVSRRLKSGSLRRVLAVQVPVLLILADFAYNYGSCFLLDKKP
jgi:hypothetical protein